MCQDSEYNRPDFVALRDLHAQDMTINTNMPTTQSGNNMNHSSPAKNYQSPNQSKSIITQGAPLKTSSYAQPQEVRYGQSSYSPSHNYNSSSNYNSQPAYVYGGVQQQNPAQSNILSGLTGTRPQQANHQSNVVYSHPPSQSQYQSPGRGNILNSNSHQVIRR